MLESYAHHNRFNQGLAIFAKEDPHLSWLSRLKYQHSPNWWEGINLDTPGVYILTGGRQIGKSTSCKLWIKHCIKQKKANPKNILYLPCDEIFNAQHLSETLRFFLDKTDKEPFLLIVDEITYVKDWDRVIKALADEGRFRYGIGLLTGSDTIILREAAMRFPGRRGEADKTDFHLYPLTFKEYITLVNGKGELTEKKCDQLFAQYLKCGGYLRAINDIAKSGEIALSTFKTYEQWVCGDFIKAGKSDTTLKEILATLLTVNVSQVSYSNLTNKIGTLSKTTLIDYCNILEHMDILINLQAYDLNKKQGSPKKDRKFHFTDPFIYQTFSHWLRREGYLNTAVAEQHIVEAIIATYYHRQGRTFYFKGHGEIDIISLVNNKEKAVEVKWAGQIRANDLKMIKTFNNSLILTKNVSGVIGHTIQAQTVAKFLSLGER